MYNNALSRQVSSQSLYKTTFLLAFNSAILVWPFCSHMTREWKNIKSWKFLCLLGFSLSVNLLLSRLIGKIGQQQQKDLWKSRESFFFRPPWTLWPNKEFCWIDFIWQWTTQVLLDSIMFTNKRFMLDVIISFS